MKVKSKSPREWVGPYQIASKIMFWASDESEALDKFGDWLNFGRNGGPSLLRKLCNWVESIRVRFDKPYVRIDNHDTWCFASSLAPIVLPMLIQYKKNLHGHPSELSEKEWERILDQMIWSFRQLNNDDDTAKFFTHPPYEEHNCKTGEDYVDNMMARVHLIKIDHDGLNCHEKQKQKGLELFGKYFQNLWD